MPDSTSAEAIENSVESAETLQKPQLVDADTTETSVDSTEPIDVESSEEPDMMKLLLGEDAEEPVETGKNVPEGQYLKLKERNKTMKQELDRLRSQQTQPQPAQPQVEAPLQTAPEPPDPDKYADGVHDAKYLKDFTQYQADVVTRAVQEQLVQKNAQMEADAYLSKYQERIDRSLPIANARIEELKQKDPGFKQRMENRYFMETLSKLPAEALTAIVESNSPESLVNYYTHKPERLQDLTRNSIDELLNLGQLIGKVNGVSGTRKTVSKPIKPIKSGKDTRKLHPIKDYAKYDHDSVDGHRKWEKDLEKFNTRS
jgi:hypothetical protein